MLVQNDSYVILSHFDCHPFKADSEPHLDVREHIFALKKKKFYGGFDLQTFSNSY